MAIIAYTQQVLAMEHLFGIQANCKVGILNYIEKVIQNEDGYRVFLWIRCKELFYFYCL